MENLYFTYLFTLRAVQKAAPLLQALRYDSGYAAEDDQTAQLVSKLVRRPEPAVTIELDAMWGARPFT